MAKKIPINYGTTLDWIVEFVISGDPITYDD